MSPGFLPCFWLFSTEPTDRALAGWCPLPRHLASERAAAEYVVSAVCSGGAMHGDFR